MNENFETSNINLKWLDNIYEEIRILQDIERLAREGCRTLGDYMQIPLEMRQIIIPDTQYKNLKFFIMELDMLIDNLSPVLSKKGEEDKTKKYKDRVDKVSSIINKRELFLRDKKSNNSLIAIHTLPLLDTTLEYLSLIKSDIIRDIGHILYLPDNEIKKW